MICAPDPANKLSVAVLRRPVEGARRGDVLLVRLGHPEKGQRWLVNKFIEVSWEIWEGCFRFEATRRSERGGDLAQVL